METDKPMKKRPKSLKQTEFQDESDVNDGEVLLQTTDTLANMVIEGERSVETARNEQDAMLIDISKDFHQEEDIGPSTNQQLADIISKCQSAKLTDIKIKENLEKYSRPANSYKLSVQITI